jgi:HEPN domain-containing protein
MARDGSLYPADWLRIAERDLRRVQDMLAAHDPAAAGFFLQQAVEKFLKAFLLCRGWQLRRIHSLDALLDDAVSYDPSLEQFRPVCQKITAFYFLERYPLLVDAGPTEEDVRSSLEHVQGFIQRLRKEVSP